MRSATLFGTLAVLAAMSAGADVTMTEAKVTVDGRLDEPCWQTANWEGDFRKLANVTVNREVKAKTRFAILADATTLYVGVKCDEDDMASVRAREPGILWADNSVELFLCPTGSSFDYYHFAVGFNPKNANVCEFASEGGNIHPDPYAPVWQATRAECAGGWSAEFAIPLSSFYMTRNRAWRGEWLVNVTRNRMTPRELTTWSPLEACFLEPARFRKMKGFPMRADADDVALRDVTAVLSGRRDGALVGTLELKATVRVPGAYILTSPALEPTEVTLKEGDTRIKAPCRYAANGRIPTELTLTRKETGAAYTRTFPVLVDFEDIRVKLTTPEYRDNFYPGQDATRIEGRVACAAAGPVKLALEGPGIPRVEKTLPQSGSFSFETPGFAVGAAFLTVVSPDGVEKKIRIRKLAPTGHRMAWISKGNLIVDGKPTLRRNLYATYYVGGQAYREKWDRDEPSFGTTPEVFGGGTLEPGRVIPGLERKEAIRDVVPCKEYFEKIDALLARNKDRDFVYYYISDEPECRGVSPFYLKHVYEYIKEKDPYHVVLTASRGGKRYVECADWFETHPYLDPHYDSAGVRRFGTEPGEMGSYIEAFDVADRPDKCVGFLPTAFAYRGKSLLNDYPTFDEYYCGTWAAMIYGGKTLYPFMWADMGERPSLYEGTRYLFTTFGALQDYVLHAKRTWIVREKAVRGVRYDLPDRSAFVLVNVTTEPQRVAVNGLKGTYREFRGARTFACNGRQTTFDLKPLEVVIATTGDEGKGLATHAQTAARIDALEAERVGRDNQLCERYEDVVWSGSKSIGLGYQLIDGVRDIQAFVQEWAKEPYLEMSFPKKAPSFAKVRIFGRWQSAPVVRLRKDGEWVTPEPQSVTPLTDGVEIAFAQVQKAIKIRIAFPKGPKATNNHVEVYEIELARHPSSQFGRTAAAGTCRKPTDAHWLLDGSNCRAQTNYTGKAWFGNEAQTAPTADGGFEITGTATRILDFSPEYPWVVARCEAFAPVEEGKYLAWGLWAPSRTVGWLMGGVTHPQPGLYTIRLPSALTNRVSEAVRLQNHNFRIRFGYISNEKQPADLLAVSGPAGKAALGRGDVLTVTLDLAEPCEEVNAGFFCDRGGGGGLMPFSVNGSNALTLVRTDATGRHWKGTVTYDRSDKSDGHAVYVRANVLGGALDLPIFTTCRYRFL